MGFSLEDAYYTEQLLLVAFALTAFALFCAQWQSASDAAASTGAKRGNVKHRLHRVGILAAALQLAVSIDPYGVRGVFEPLAVSWIGANLTALFVAALAFLNQTAVEVVFLSKLRKVPAAVAALTWLAVLAVFTGANVSYALVLRTGRWWYSAIDLLLSASVLLVICVSFVVVAIKIVRALNSAGGSQRSVNSSSSSSRGSRRNSAKRRQMIWRTVTVSLIGAAVIPLQVMAAVERLGDRKAPIDEPDTDHFLARDRLFIYGHALATLVLLWYSWVPFSSKKRDGYQRVDTFADQRSRSRSTSRSRSYSSSRHRVGSASDLDADGDDAPAGGWKSATHRRLRGAGDEDLDISEPIAE